MIISYRCQTSKSAFPVNDVPMAPQSVTEGGTQQKAKIKKHRTACKPNPQRIRCLNSRRRIQGTRRRAQGTSDAIAASLLAPTIRGAFGSTSKSENYEYNIQALSMFSVPFKKGLWSFQTFLVLLRIIKPA